MEVVAAVAPLAQPGWIETPFARPVHLFPIRKNSHPSPPPCSPTSAPSTSPSPLLAPISRPPIDPGAAPCACGCTFIVHAGHRGAKHNHVSETTHFRTILTFVENQGLAREIKVVSGDCESLPLLWTIKVPDSSLLPTHVFFQNFILDHCVVFVLIHILAFQGAGTAPTGCQPDSFSPLLPSTQPRCQGRPPAL